MNRLRFFKEKKLLSTKKYEKDLEIDENDCKMLKKYILEMSHKCQRGTKLNSKVIVLKKQPLAKLRLVQYSQRCLYLQISK